MVTYIPGVYKDIPQYYYQLWIIQDCYTTRIKIHEIYLIK